MRSTPVPIRDWLEYSSVGGRELGLSLHEYETSLRIDLQGNVAFLEDHQPTSDKGGEPLGTSRAVVPLPLANQLRDVLAASDLASVPRSPRSGPGRSSIRIRHTTGSASVEAVFSNRDLDVLRNLAPLLQTLDDISAFVAETPFQAIRLSLESTPDAAALTFSVGVTNVGSEAVYLPDLAELARNSAGQPDRWFGVRVAEYPEPTPGFTPPPFDWVRVELAGPWPASSPPHLLEPARKLAFRTVPVKRLAPGVRYLVQAVFSSYAGEAVLDGRVIIRGRALSTALRWTPPDH
jgi:hypothetical protein